MTIISLPKEPNKGLHLSVFNGPLARACTQLQSYLKQKPGLSDSDRRLYDDIPTRP